MIAFLLNNLYKISIWFLIFFLLSWLCTFSTMQIDILILHKGKDFQLVKRQIGMLCDLYSIGLWPEALCGSSGRRKKDWSRKSLGPTLSRMPGGYLPYRNKVLDDLQGPVQLDVPRFKLKSNSKKKKKSLLVVILYQDLYQVLERQRWRPVPALQVSKKWCWLWSGKIWTLPLPLTSYVWGNLFLGETYSSFLLFKRK